MDQPMHSNEGSSAFLWLLIAAWTAVTLTSLFAPQILSFNTSRYINVALMTVFTLVHGARRYDWSGVLAYFAIAVVISNIFENMSIATGFPFGAYHHTAAMGPQLLHVPLIIGPIFAVAGYLGWVLAGILLGDVFSERRGGALLAKPIIAAFITTSWDFCVDPIGGTINRDWIWVNGGGYFGVSWINYLGWMLTMWLIFQLFAVFLALRGKPAAVVPATRYWLPPVVLWTLIGLQFPLLFAITPKTAGSITDPAGTAWQVADLLETMALASFFTMLFVAVLSFLLLFQSRPQLSQPWQE